ncbi:MAG: GNAT family N-acetyltransferase [Proteobacteria bacterium]|nr:GNAT family N-acetyltransferase [Pseudomonadota bacterium]
MYERFPQGLNQSTFKAREYTLKSGEKVLIRPGSPDDAEAMLAIKLQILAEQVHDSLLPEEYLSDAEQEAEWIASSLSTFDSFLGVACHDDEPIGVLYFKCSQELRCAHWGEFGMGIDRAWRGQGIGTLLLDTLFAWAEGHPTVEKICLKVFDANPDAHRLYQRYGFTEEGRLLKCLKLGPERYSDAILMGKFVKKRN